MKAIHFVGATLLALTSSYFSPAVTAQVINIDFQGTRTDGDTPEPTPGSANGFPSGFPDGGSSSFYNDVVADDTSDSDNLTVTANNLFDSNGDPTMASFTIAPSALITVALVFSNGSYLFTNSANNGASAVPFTIGGLGAATNLNIIFFTTFVADLSVPVVTFAGSTTPATVSDNPNVYTYEYDNVPVIGGVVSGTIGDQATADPLILSGLAFEIVPEPSTWAMLGLGAAMGAVYLRRRARA